MTDEFKIHPEYSWATSYYRKDLWFSSLILLTLISALFFRFYNYSYRVYVESDNTRDVQVAKYAWDAHKLPQVGQYTSAGPFFYGPIWYWVLETFSAIPLGKFSQWYLMTVLGLGLVFLAFKTGLEIGGKYVGAVAAFLTAISPLMIRNSLAVWNPASVPLFVFLSWYFFIRYLKTDKLRFVFLTSLVTSAAITIHFQNILTTPLLLLLFILRKFTWKKIMVLLVGIVLPLMPLVWFDLRFNWVNFSHIYWYLSEGQYAIWVPNRWLTYAFDYWPKAVTEIVGGNFYVSYLLIVSMTVLFLINLKNAKKHRYIYFILVVFVFEVIFFRYYRGERFLYYSYFAVPTVILLTAWSMAQVFKINKYAGGVFFLIVGGGTFWSAITQLTPPPYAYSFIEKAKKDVYAAYPGQNFSIYGCLFNGNTVAHPLAYFMYLDGRNSKNGVKIGVCESAGTVVGWKVLGDDEVGKANSAWINKDTSQVFAETVEWWVYNPPQ